VVSRVLGGAAVRMGSVAWERVGDLDSREVRV